MTNLTKPLPRISESTTAEEFCSWFTGANLRWESVGVIYALAGLAASYPEAREVFERDNLAASDMYSASNICLEICDEHNQVNDLTIWHRYTNFALASSLFGDTSMLAHISYSYGFSYLEQTVSSTEGSAIFSPSWLLWVSTAKRLCIQDIFFSVRDSQEIIHDGF